MKILISRLPEQPVNWRSFLFREYDGRKIEILTVNDFRFAWRSQLQRLRNLTQDLRDMGISVAGTDSTKFITDKPIQKRSAVLTPEQQPPRKSNKAVPDLSCTGCGRTNHLVDTCQFGSSIFFNPIKVAYRDSAKFAEFRRIHPTATVVPSSKDSTGIVGKSTSGSSSTATSVPKS